MLESLKQWREGDLYARQQELTFWECDAMGRIRPAAVLSLMAAAAGWDYDAWGLPYEKLYAMGQVFLLSRLAFRLHQYAVPGEVVTVTTWEDGARAAHMRRNFRLLRQDGSPMASGRSEWILVDPEDRRILRPSAFTGKAITAADRPVDCPACRRVLLSGEETETLGTRQVMFSDLDHNGHLFSGNYGDIIWDYLPRDLQTAALREFQINYSKEATLGDTLTLLGRRTGGGYRMEGLRGPERCFTCECTF